MSNLVVSPMESVEFIPTDYALAYSALARRVASAEAFLASDLQDRAYEQLCRAMDVIEQVEKVCCVVKALPNDH
jgi:hypothetical protein